MTSSDTLLQRLVFQYLHLSAASTWKPSGQSDLNLLEYESGKAMTKDCKNHVLRMWPGGWVYKQFSWSCHVEVWTQLLCRCSRPGVFFQVVMSLNANVMFLTKGQEDREAPCCGVMVNVTSPSDAPKWARFYDLWCSSCIQITCLDLFHLHQCQHLHATRFAWLHIVITDTNSKTMPTKTTNWTKDQKTVRIWSVDNRVHGAIWFVAGLNPSYRHRLRNWLWFWMTLQWDGWCEAPSD